MKNKLILLLGIGIGLFLLSYMFAFQVGYNEVAVRATFGKADADNVITEPGLNLRLPWPFQQVFTYSTRAQIVETQLDQIQTEDGYAIIVRTYLTWRIKDPLKFYISLRTQDAARQRLAKILQSDNAITGKYKFAQIVNTDPKQLKLAQIEDEALTRISEQLKKLDYGIVAEHLGIRRMVLPKDVTTKVFDRMKSNRKKLAADVLAGGTSRASEIVSKAKSTRDRIMSFANKYAEDIKTKGKTQAAQLYKQFAVDQDFAIFLKKLEVIEATLRGSVTIIGNVTQLSPMHPWRMLAQEPKPPAKQPAGAGGAAPPENAGQD